MTNVLINNPKLIDICLDKHKLLNFLSVEGLPVPEHGIVGKDMPKKYPVIIKPRRGQGNKGIKKVQKIIKNNAKNEEIWQEFLLPEDKEFTCAVYVDPNKDYRLLQIKRILMGGNTVKGEISDNKEIKNYIEKIVHIFNTEGCFNVQLRLTKAGPLIFEINPRLSSTLVFRDKLGFEDLKWWITDKLGLDPLIYKKPKTGIRIYRGNSEYMI